MGDWQTCPLGELVENLDARRLPVKEADRRPGPYPYYGASGVVDYVDSYLFDGLHLLIAEDGENLRTRKLPIAFLADGKFWVNNHAHIVRGNSRADTRFLCYALQVADVTSYLTGSTMPKLTQGNLHRIPILTPSLGEQEAIASILGALDDKIDLSQRMNETLEAMARAIFKDWFVDFGPTRAKMEGREPYLAPDLWALFPDRLDGDGKPEGWARLRLEQIAQYCTGTVSPAGDPDGLFEHYSLPAYDSGQEPAIDLGVTIKSNKTLVPEGAVLLSKLNPDIPRVWIINRPTENKQVSSTEFLPFLPKAPVGRSVLFCLFSDNVFRRTLQGMVTGTSKSHQRVSPSALLSLDVISGTEFVFRAFEDKVAPILERTVFNRTESRSLAQTRDLLLPKLMSGEIRVSEAMPIGEGA